MNIKHPLMGVRLPESLQEIREVIGMESALKLVADCGGTRIFIPKYLPENHRLVTLLGMEVAERLSQYFGGESLSIIRWAEALRVERNMHIIDQYSKGSKIGDLARRFKLTERRIYTIVSRPAV